MVDSYHIHLFENSLLYLLLLFGAFCMFFQGCYRLLFIYLYGITELCFFTQFYIGIRDLSLDIKESTLPTKSFYFYHSDQYVLIVST